MDDLYGVSGKWKYQFRTVDKRGRLIDFKLSDPRNIRAAYRSLGKALDDHAALAPSSITKDQLGSYPEAISRLQREAGDQAHRASHL